MSLKKISLVISCTYILLSTSEAFAQRFSRGSSGAKVGPSIGAMVMFGQGKMGNDTDVLSRSMIYTPVAVFAGFNIRKFRLGLNYEYNLVGQSDDPANFAGQNIGGKGSAPGVRLGYYNGKTAVEAIYRLSEKYTLDKPTATGATSEYEIKSGYGVQIYTQVKKKFGIVLDYSMGEYKSSNALSNDIKWDRVSLGLVFSNFAGSSGSGSRSRSRR